MGNHPQADLMVISPNRVPFLIDVKGLYKKNYWLVRQQPARVELFYVFVFVPDNSSNQFFVLTQEQVNEGIRTDLEHAKARKKAKGTVFDEKKAYMSSVEWNFALRHKDAWSALPE
jgi:hypothetical protein